ncbi:peroxynitrite isomerase THAP4-like isoform X2 [Homalodisca vitripennis]|nr:peroxynitrite isomerase THAP4-like isoform X2 [Homalodisca vitripennis]XP_046688450.1 peroxynitrite isomerase THAP4-like isoform X2 [Homalodisca vitripennis]
MQASLPIHEALKTLSWLIGKWVGNGLGEYPTITRFKYCEELEFTSLGQPLLNYTSRTWHAEKKNPMHFESGFLRIKPGTRDVAFMISHNFGLSEVEEGQVEDLKLVTTSQDIKRMSFAKDPGVTQIHREYSLQGDVLSLTLSMATTNTPLTKHLTVTYKKIS